MTSVIRHQTAKVNDHSGCSPTPCQLVGSLGILYLELNKPNHFNIHLEKITNCGKWSGINKLGYFIMELSPSLTL